MKLHKDGTLEGTPEEIAKYQDLKRDPIKDICTTATSIGKPIPDNMRYPAQSSIGYAQTYSQHQQGN